MTRLLFHPGHYLQITKSDLPFPITFGTPLPAASDQASLAGNVGRTTKNNGNLVHAEAMARVLDCHPSQSAACRLTTIHRHFKGEATQIRAFLKEHFDGIVLSFANIVRPWQPPTRQGEPPIYSMMAEVIRTSPIPVFAFGIGVQEADATTSLPASLLELLGTINDHAAIFGVRGRKTEGVLHQLGFDRARALGCPSFFVHPRNVVRASRQPIASAERIVTAGYLNNRQYTLELTAAMRGCEPAYVFQNDLYILLNQPAAEPGFYDDATGTCDKSAVEELLQQRFGMKPDFRSYHYFRTTQAWRTFFGSQDLFLGARLHGGVCALQAGRPAILLAKDDRVQELAEFFDLPSWPLGQAAELGAARLLEKVDAEDGFTRFRRSYGERLEAFVAHCQEKGLRFNTAAETALALQEIDSAPASAPLPGRTAHWLRRWLPGRGSADRVGKG